MTALSNPLNLDTWQPPEQTLASGSLDGAVDARGADWRGVTVEKGDLRGANLCRADFRGADLSEAGLESAESIKGADFSLTKGLNGQRDALLARPFEELDCWNPLTRSTTRDSLESLS